MPVLLLFARNRKFLPDHRSYLRSEEFDGMHDLIVCRLQMCAGKRVLGKLIRGELTRIGSRDICLCRFPSDHRCLAGAAPVVFACFPTGTDDAVAGYEEGYGVAADCGAYGPGSSGAADLSRDGGIGGQAAHWDVEQGFPYL